MSAEEILRGAELLGCVLQNFVNTPTEKVAVISAGQTCVLPQSIHVELAAHRSAAMGTSVQ